MEKTQAEIEEWHDSVRRKWVARKVDETSRRNRRRATLAVIGQHALDAGYATGLDDEDARVAYAESIINPPKARAKRPAKTVAS